MTEAEWLACDDPQLMFDFFREKISSRKMRLYGCACCRRIWHLLKDNSARDSLHVAELFADGSVEESKRSAARKVVQQVAQSRAVTRTPNISKWERRAASAVYYATARDATDAAWNAQRLAVEALIWLSGGYAKRDSSKIMRAEESSQACILRDIFGNPFRPEGTTLDCLTTSVVALAQAAYDERSLPEGTLELGCLAILADALEEASCDNAALLSHLRSPGPHVRGCWALDLILGRE